MFLNIILQQNGATTPVTIGEIARIAPGSARLCLKVSGDDVVKAWRVAEKGYALSEPDDHTKSGTPRPVFFQDFEVLGNHTNSQENGLRLLVLKNDGVVEHWHIVVVTQGDKSYVVTVMKGAGKLQRFNGCLFVEHTQVFAEMLHHLEGKPEVASVEVIEKLPERRKPAALKGKQGRIKWFHLGRGQGVIAYADGRDLRIHWRQAQPDAMGFRAFYPGQIVEVGEIHPAQDSRSKLKEEAFNVTLLSDPQPVEAPHHSAVTELVGKTAEEAVPA
jgi:cold shock CspA family protein